MSSPDGCGHVGIQSDEDTEQPAWTMAVRTTQEYLVVWVDGALPLRAVKHAVGREAVSDLHCNVKGSGLDCRKWEVTAASNSGLIHHRHF